MWVLWIVRSNTSKPTAPCVMSVMPSQSPQLALRGRAPSWLRRFLIRASRRNATPPFALGTVDRSRGAIGGPVVVAVPLVRMVPLSVHDVVGVALVRDALMAAVGSVDV